MSYENGNGNGNGNGHTNGNGNRLAEYGPRPGLAAAIERAVPHNAEAERAVLGAVLLDEEKLLEIVDMLCVEDFWRDVHQLYYRAILDLYDKGDPIDAVTIANELMAQGNFEKCGGDDYLTRLYTCVPHAANVKYHAEVVKAHALMRRTIENSKQTIEEAQSFQYAPQELLRRHADRMLEIEHQASVEEEDLSVHPLPTKMDPAAFRGLVGDIVRIIEPHTEACPEAILAQLIVLFAGAMGPRPHWRVGGSIHRSNLFLCLVGPTGISRKGTAFDAAYWLLTRDDRRDSLPLAGGLTSGEGLILAARDSRGPLICVETEFGKTLGNMARENCNLSGVFRQAWDGPRLRVMTKNNPLDCEDSYISVIGHITQSELRKKVTQNDVANGLVNRFMWLNVYRNGELPEGGDFGSVKQALHPLLREVALSIDFARKDSGHDVPFQRDEEARELWKQLYTDLTAQRPGDYGSATVRAAPIVMRLAVIYAVIDQTFYIGKKHLESALAFWKYCDQTAAHIFGSPKQDGNMAKLMAFLEKSKGGVTRTEINRKVFKGHLAATELDRLLTQAQGAGGVVYRRVKTRGADRHEWLHKKNDVHAEKAE